MKKSTKAKKYLLENGKLTLKDGKIYNNVMCVYVNDSAEIKRNIGPYTMVFLVWDKRVLIHFDKIQSFDITPRIKGNKALREGEQYEKE